MELMSLEIAHSTMDGFGMLQMKTNVSQALEYETLVSATREAIGVSYVDADAKLLDGNTKPLSREDELSWKDWVCEEIDIYMQIDEVYDNGLGLEHPMLPRVYPQFYL